jgi:hypothetical protein
VRPRERDCGPFDDDRCTLFGLLPLAPGPGAGSELQRPLARV